jgi:hypothetical protein
MEHKHVSVEMSRQIEYLVAIWTIPNKTKLGHVRSSTSIGASSDSYDQGFITINSNLKYLNEKKEKSMINQALPDKTSP